MKIVPLNPTDLAKFAVLPQHQLYTAITTYSSFVHGYTYSPLRQNFPDIFSIRMGEIDDKRAVVDFSHIEHLIKKKCDSSRRPEQNFKNNIWVARVLFDFCRENKVFGVKHAHEPFRTLQGFDVRLWENAAFTINGKKFVLLVDPRGETSALDVESRRFVFSLMNEQIRKLDPTMFADFELGVLQFNRKGFDLESKVVLHEAKGIQLYSYEELKTRIAEVCKVWVDVQQERAIRKIEGQLTGDLPLFQAKG
ncbi:hypothetical protein MXMO3_02739 [Maritalea myrionectae]|uniref:Uncharacterized protein n=1 Tax=Maritalea myrionectae TaxID=454601 RepID=A0A2R4MGX4_9HYPH|nr:hypothetical protein [Maritalea myrionectae]AVX05250.1 hypothetical protein MXMO3_02739 [Maritalea myrionectae]